LEFGDQTSDFSVKHRTFLINIGLFLSSIGVCRSNNTIFTETLIHSNEQAGINIKQLPVLLEQLLSIFKNRRQITN